MSKTPFETAQYNAMAFGTNLIYITACSETIKALEEMRVESSALLKEFKTIVFTPEQRLAHKEAVKANVADRKFLLETFIMQDNDLWDAIA